VPSLNDIELKSITVFSALAVLITGCPLVRPLLR
jgi:hypothetical protein